MGKGWLACWERILDDESLLQRQRAYEIWVEIEKGVPDVSYPTVIWGREGHSLGIEVQSDESVCWFFVWDDGEKVHRGGGDELKGITKVVRYLRCLVKDGSVDEVLDILAQDGVDNGGP